MSFTELGLSAGLVSALSSLGMLEPLRIQSLAIPAALSGRDLLALSPTGSGKTVAFAAPILEGLSSAGFEDKADEAPGIRALVLVPTRELAVQVAAVFEAVADALPGGRRIRVRLAYGGVSINTQMLALRGGADVLVATPGRLLDLARRNAARLGNLRFLVLDEADRMMDAAFSDELSDILALLPRKRQTMLFSATFREATASLLGPALDDPLRIGEESLPEGTGARIVHRAIPVAPEDKGPLLRKIITEGLAAGWQRVLVFTSSNRRADNVTRKLVNNGIAALAFHGDLTQANRGKALEDFRGGSIRVLVASDLASRGLDIMDLDCVINYEFGRSPLDYVHRAGRTGRSSVDAAAGGDGLVISLVAPEDEAMARLIEKKTGLRLQRT